MSAQGKLGWEVRISIHGPSSPGSVAVETWGKDIVAFKDRDNAWAIFTALCHILRVFKP